MEGQSKAYVPLVVEVLLSAENGLSIPHRTRDVGLGGILLETKGFNRLKPGMRVDAAFVPARTLRTRVASVTDNTIELIYERLDADDIVFLSDLLQTRRIDGCADDAPRHSHLRNPD